MNEWDKAYMELQKSKPEPEDDIRDTYAYLAGCIIAIVFWVWFLMWLAS